MYLIFLHINKATNLIVVIDFKLKQINIDCYVLQ
jgi:hypothetical protein